MTLPAESIIDINNNSIYLIKQGTLKETFNDNVIVHYEDGDLVGVDALFQKKLTRLNTEFAIIVDEYDGLELLNYIRTDKSRNQAWIHFLTNLNQSYKVLIAQHKQNETQLHPEIRDYKAGEIIIQEDEKGDEVFTLISGNALAMVGNTLVGEIKCDEVFGAIAAFTNTPRTATIKAESDCTVMVVTNSRFIDLLATHPETVTKLIQDMARTIVSGNEKIISLSK